MSLTVIVPSRGRPKNIERLLYWFEKTKQFESTRLLVVADHDDPALGEYKEIVPDQKYKVDSGLGDYWASLAINCELKRLNPILNHYAFEAAKDQQFVGFMGDDHIPCTPGWDAKLTNVLSWCGGGVSYGNDLLQRQNLPTAVVMSSSLILGLGYMSPPALTHLYMDNFWKMLGEATSLKYLHDVIIEHIHPLAGKAEFDDAYRISCGEELMSEDRDKYLRYLTDQWPHDLGRLRSYLDA